MKENDTVIIKRCLNGWAMTNVNAYETFLFEGNFEGDIELKDYEKFCDLLKTLKIMIGPASRDIDGQYKIKIEVMERNLTAP